MKKWWLIVAIIPATFIIVAITNLPKLLEPLSQTKLRTNKATQPIIFLLPHQDDEMFLAGAILQYLDQSKSVYVVMVTDGAASIVRTILNGHDDAGHKIYCHLHHRYHNPNKEGYQPFDIQTFSAARNQEFYKSMIQLGVRKDHILFANPGGLEGSTQPLYQDGALTKIKATQAIKTLFDTIGDGTYITLDSRRGEAWHRNPDHLALQEALVDFQGIGKKYYYPDQEYPGKLIYLTADQSKRKDEALQNYYTWNPVHGQFAIGQHSVEYLLEDWRHKKFEYRADR